MKKIFFIFAISLLITSCTKENKAPTANAGIDQSIHEGAIVTLDGSASADLDGNALTYHWTAPPGITLSSDTEAKPTFVAPEVSTETNYTFSLVINDGQTDSPPDEVVITVVNVDKFLTFIKAGQTDGIGIRYVDIIPDDTLIINGYPNTLAVTRRIDLNNDKTDDFGLKYEMTSPLFMGGSGSSVKIFPLGTNSVCITKTNVNWADPLSSNSSISDNNNWSNSPAILYSSSSFMDGSVFTYGYWYNNDNIYIGVKIIKDDKQLFGWIDVKDNVLRRYAVTVPY